MGELPDYMAEGLKTLPSHMRNGAFQYVANGVPPGGFLRAVLENNLLEAFGRADSINRHHMQAWCEYIYNSTPHTCHGSPEIVNAWIARGGLSGRSQDND